MHGPRSAARCTTSRTTYPITPEARRSLCGSQAGMERSCLVSLFCDHECDLRCHASLLLIIFPVYRPALTHAWVNIDYMLDECLVGFMVSE